LPAEAGGGVILKQGMTTAASLWAAGDRKSDTRLD
jgi:hypothetical protein